MTVVGWLSSFPERALCIDLVCGGSGRMELIPRCSRPRVAVERFARRNREAHGRGERGSHHSSNGRGPSGNTFGRCKRWGWGPGSGNRRIIALFGDATRGVFLLDMKTVSGEENEWGEWNRGAERRRDPNDGQNLKESQHSTILERRRGGEKGENAMRRCSVQERKFFEQEERKKENFFAF